MPDGTCMVCGRVIPEGRHICLSCEGQNEMQQFTAAKPETNGDRIRAMSDADLADFLDTITNCCNAYVPKCDICPMKYADEIPRCNIGGWLKKEAQSE